MRLTGAAFYPFNQHNVEDAMLAKCANPACSATFHYFHEGKLFAIESRIDWPRRGPPADLKYTGRSHSPQYFWLCSSCCRAMTVQSDGLVLIFGPEVAYTQSGEECA